MLSYQKNTLLALLANFKARLYNTMEEDNRPLSFNGIAILTTIDRNLTSIEKQLKKL